MAVRPMHKLVATGGERATDGRFVLYSLKPLRLCRITSQAAFISDSQCKATAHGAAPCAVWGLTKI